MISHVLKYELGMIQHYLLNLRSLAESLLGKYEVLLYKTIERPTELLSAPFHEYTYMGKNAQQQ